MSIWTAVSGEPGVSVGTLTSPATITANALNAYTASGINLDPNTTYIVWVDSNSGERNVLQNTSQTAEDSGAQSGWSIGDNSLYRAKDQTAGAWSSYENMKKIAVKGYANGSTNNAPMVANAIPDQSATAGTAFSYVFPDTTFNDTDTGDTLSYAATKADDTTLPTWLAFTDSTRTFSGTAAAADVGTVAVKVTASDGNGGSVSDTFDITVATTVPGAPDSLTATASGSTTIDLSWSAPDTTGGSAVTGYRIEVSPDGTTNWTELVADTAATAYAHTGLAAGTTRHYRVSAINANGTGLPSSTADATTGTTVPGAPDSLTATASGSTTIDLSWSAPDTTGGSAVTGYRIEVSPDGTTNWTELVADTAATAYAHTGLAAGTTRHYRVSAINTNGTGLPSSTADATTGTTVPGAPDSLTATASGSTTIDLSWSAPDTTGGSAVTGYRIEVSPDGTTNWTELVADTAATAYAHTGLAAGTTRHTNGTGLPSSTADATTGTTVPGAPDSLTATASGSTTIDLSSAVQASSAVPPANSAPTVSNPIPAPRRRRARRSATDTGRYARRCPRRLHRQHAHLPGTRADVGTVKVTASDGCGSVSDGRPRHHPPTRSPTDGWPTTNGTGLPSTPTPPTPPSRPNTTPLRRTPAPPAARRPAAGQPHGNGQREHHDRPRTPPAAPPPTPARPPPSHRLQDRAGAPRSSPWTGPHAPLPTPPGLPSRTADATTGCPAAVTGYRIDRVSPTTNGTAPPAWTAREHHDRRSPWTPDTPPPPTAGYRIEVSPDGTTNWTELVADTAATAYAHTGLAAGTTRHYRVSAINANGTGLPSRTADATTGTTVPGAPASLTATASGSTTIDLSWSAPASDGGSAITNYKIEDSSDGGSTWFDLAVAIPSTDTTYAHTGLAAGTTRHYRVSAINSVGTGLSSDVANATTDAATPNAAPTMANAIPDQTATAGKAFSYAFPDTTFNDTDTGDTLSYEATKADDTALPTWLAFTDSTRTFAGTPAVADTGTVSVKVTASDGNGGSVGDEFDIVVRAATTTPTAAASLVSNLGQTQHSGSLPLNSWDVVQGFETGASGYTLVSVDLRLNRQSAGTSIAVPSVKLMEGTKTATSVTLTGQPVTLTAEVAQVTSTTGENYTFTAPSGTTLSASTRYFLVVERVGTRVQWMTTASTGEDAPPASAAGWSIDDERWRRSASNTGNFTGKVARSQLLRVNGNTNTSTNAAPTVPNAIPDQTATAGKAFSYAFPDTTFNDTDTGDTLSYAATKADDTALPTWLAFTDGTRTFAGTPALADTGTVSVKVTASDGNGGSVGDEFDITVRDLGICARTVAVRDALLARIAGVTDCALVTDTHLAAITGTLDLSYESITVLAAGDFDGLTALTYLDLEHNSLTALPAGVFDELTALTTLNLFENLLTALPAGVFDKLTALTTLLLEDISLTALPAGVFDKLTALTRLDLSRNSLTALPAGVFDKLTALTALLLEDNSLTALPAGVFDELTALTELYLHGNSLTALPADVFDELTALLQLTLALNSLAELPDDVFEPLTSLNTLTLGDNPGAPFSPTAVALPDDGTVPAAGGTVMLDGSGSGGAWGTNVVYAWALRTPTTGVTVTFDDAAIAEPTVTIPPVTAGTDLVFTLTVTGRGGSNGISTATDTAAVTVNATEPGAPTSLTATASGTTTINLSWTAPADNGGSAITGYKIEVSLNGTSNWTELVANTNSTIYTHSGLAAGDTRHYRVSAINSVGTSTTSNVANATTNTANTAPGAPTSLTATASGSTTINLSWTAPASTGGSAVTGYKIEVSLNGTSNWTELVANTNSTTTTYTHAGLAAADTRHYRVSAINSVGTGTTSNVASATTDTGIDTRAPVLTGPTVNGTALVLAYDETLDGASVPAAGAFAVTAAGSTVTVNGVSVGGSAVTLTLASAVRANQTVALDYTPGTNPIRDGAGNDAAALSGRSVTNYTPGVGPMPRVSIGPWLLSVSEDVGDAVLTVSLDRPAASALSVAWHTQDHTAESPDDFTASEDPVTFAAGETRKTISVRIVDDAVREDPVHDVHELFFVMLSPGEGYTLADNPLADSSTALVEIVDNDGVGSMDEADDALALVDGVTPEVAAAVLIGEQTLGEAQLDALDRLGNGNGRYDIGDLLSWIARCRRGEARCGSSSTDSGPASAAMLAAAAAGSRSTPRRPRRRDSGRRGRCRRRASTGGIRRRARMAGQVLAILLAATMTWSCTEGGLVGPVAAPPDPGFLTVEWSGPATNRDVGVLLELDGPTIGAVRAPGLELYESSAPGPHRIVVAGVLRPGPLVQFRVPDRNRFALYSVRVVEVTGEDYGLRDAGEYQAVIKPTPQQPGRAQASPGPAS